MIQSINKSEKKTKKYLNKVKEAILNIFRKFLQKYRKICRIRKVEFELKIF
jgi:hypothetical protein